MNFLQDYDDSDTTTGPANQLVLTSRNDETPPPAEKLFRNKSLCLASFPWTTVVSMVPFKLVDAIGIEPEKRFSFVRRLFNRFMMNIY